MVLLLAIRLVVVHCYCWWYDVAVGCVLLVVVARCGVVMVVLSCWCDVMVLMVSSCRGVVVLEYCGVVTTCNHLVSKCNHHATTSLPSGNQQVTIR